MRKNRAEYAAIWGYYLDKVYKNVYNKECKARSEKRGNVFMEQGKKYIYLVLSHPQSVVSDLIHIVTRDPYTHSALSLSPELSPMFSFGRKYSRFPFYGRYRKEAFTDAFYRRCSNVPGRIIAIPVTDDQQRCVEKRLNDFWKNRKALKYNVRGLFLGAVGIAYARPAHYTCSQFVSETLDQAGIWDFDGPYSLIRPMDLLDLDGEVIYEGDLKKYVCGNAGIPGIETNKSACRGLQ